jgi:anti-sigma regulatory factor (Ser/Thr protein kinase)
MDLTVHERVVVTERSQVVAARLVARHFAEQAGLPLEDAHRAGLVATELATNLVKHTTGGGEILVRAAVEPGSIFVELVAIDRAPGMANVARALTDGHSSAGSPGTGLGAVRRLSSVFDVYSMPGQGTIVFSRVAAARPTAAAALPASMRLGAIVVPKAGEQVSGDGWLAQPHADAVLIAIVDGLGHGAGAREAAAAALDIVAARKTAECAATLQRIHDGIRHTRGAAGAVLYLRRGAATFTFAGVGNISAVVATGSAQQHVLSSNGTLGHQATTFREYHYPWAPDATLVAHTDGLSGHWTLDRYPGLTERHPAVIAAVLYRDFNRQRDDVTVLAVQEAR